MMKERLKVLVCKLLSFKFVIFVITTVLRCFDVVGNGEWLTVTTLILAGRETQKGLNTLTKKFCEGKLNEEIVAAD